MSSNILSQKVLVLNRNFTAINIITLERAVNRMNSARSPYDAIKIEYKIDENGNPDYEKVTEFRAIPWGEWTKLAPRPYDDFSMKTPNMELRIPQTIIAHSYSKPPKAHKLKPTNENLLKVYGGIDYWSGKILTKNSTSKDHVISQHHHRQNNTNHLKDGWDNLAPTHKKINELKGSMSPEEFMEKYPEYKPHYELRKTAPEKVRDLLIYNAVPKDWRLFPPFSLNK